MDPRIGPPRDWGKAACGFSTDPEFNPTKDCGSPLVVIHIIMNDIDEEGYRPSAFACAVHEHTMPSDLILMKHSIQAFCGMEGSCWDFGLNECIMPIDKLELALLGTLDLGKDIDEEFSRDSQGYIGKHQTSSS